MALTYAQATALVSKTPITLVTIVIPGDTDTYVRAATQPAFDAAGNYYSGIIKSAPSVSVKIADPFGGQASISVGSLTLINDGDLDQYIESQWMGAAITIQHGFATSGTDYKQVFSGYISAYSMAETNIKLSLQSATEKLEQTTITAGDYGDMSLPDRVSWILGLAGITAESTSWAAWSTENAYTTRFQPSSDLTAKTALTSLLFGAAIWGVGPDGYFFVYSASDASGTADITLDEVDITSWKKIGLSQYCSITASLPAVETGDDPVLENVLPGYAELESINATNWSFDSWAGLAWNDAHTEFYTQTMPNERHGPGQVTVDASPDTYWQPFQADTPLSKDTTQRNQFALTAENIFRAYVPYGIDGLPSGLTISVQAKHDADDAWSTILSKTGAEMTTDRVGYQLGAAAAPYALLSSTITPTIPWARYFRVTFAGTWISSSPWNLDIDLGTATTVDSWAIKAGGVTAATLQYWDGSAWVDQDAQTGESTISTGSLEWFSFTASVTYQKWRVVITGDADCKVYRIKLGNTPGEPATTMTKEAAAVLANNPLAKSGTMSATYILDRDDAESVLDAALALRSSLRSKTTVAAQGIAGIASIYDVVELNTDRWGDGLYRVIGITENLATGTTTLELFA